MKTAEVKFRLLDDNEEWTMNMFITDDLRLAVRLEGHSWELSTSEQDAITTMVAYQMAEYRRSNEELTSSFPDIKSNNTYFDDYDVRDAIRLLYLRLYAGDEDFNSEVGEYLRGTFLQPDVTMQAPTCLNPPE